MAEESRNTLICDLIVTDLNLKETQFEIINESSSLKGSAVCLVHCTWLKAAKHGYELPMEVPELTPSHMHWLMQPSCSDDRIPSGWYLVRLICLSKEKISSSTDGRTLSPWRSKWSTNEFSSFLSQLTCQHQRLSWRQLINSSSSHDARVKQKPLNEGYIHCLVKQLFGKSIVKLGCNTAGSHGDEEESFISQGSNPSNIAPLLSALESEKAFYFIVPHYRHTLFDLVTHSPSAISNSTNKPLFVLYQLLQVLNKCHEMGISFGEFSLRDIFIDDRLWITMVTPLSTLSHESFEVSNDEVESDVAEDRTVRDASKSVTNGKTLPLCEALHLWQSGTISNLEYLLCLNYHVGRKFGEPNNHPVLPWVTDFSQPNGGYRDLSKSKHRLSKGDQQLDFTYVNAKEQLKTNPNIDSVYPHHIGDLLSDVTYYMYRARQTPKELLCSRVRPRWVPGEYPSSMKKLYEWTPDECIPEFYTDPLIFQSIHDDLPDLAFPSWCTTAEEFIKHHRSILEGDYVSAHLHNWIDITFGYKLQGDAAVKAKNVHLCLVDGHTGIYSHGVVQLFSVAHPKRVALTSTPYVIKHPLYNPFSSLHYGVVADGSRDHMMSLEATGKKEDTAHRIKKSMTRKELQEHLEQPGIAIDEQINTTPPSMDVLDEHGFLDVSVHYPEIMSEKVSVPRESKSKEGLLPLSLWYSRPKATRVRQRKPGTEEAPIIEYSWQLAKIQLPKDFVPAQNISRVEETGSFTYRALGEATPALQECWTKEDFCNKNAMKQHGLLRVLEKKYKNYQLSFEEQVAVDTFSAICTVIEMCCADQLRPMMSHRMSLLERLSLLIKLRNNEVIHIPNFFHKLMSNYITDGFSLTKLTIHGLPGISAPLILQQCVPVICFPSNFQFLYTKLSELNYFLQYLWYSQLNCDENFDINFCNYLSDNVPKIVSTVDSESLQIFLLHLMPYFNNRSTSFNAIITTFDTIMKYLDHDQIIKMFSPLMQDLYDRTSLSPQQKAQILHRPFLNTLIHRFGLAHFRERFISHVVEAVINPCGVHGKKEHKKGQNLTLKEERLVKPEQNMATGESKQKLSLLLDIVPEYSSSEEEGEDDTLGGETYTSLLAQTPIQKPADKPPGVEGRTYSVCSEDMISMEPIVVVSPPSLQPVNDNELPYQTSPDITSNSMFSLAPADGTPDQTSSEFCISEGQSPPASERQSPLIIDTDGDDEYKGKSDDDMYGGGNDKEDDRTDSDNDIDDDIGSTELSQFDKMLAEVASDSLQWLMHRLGPLLATKYIVRPLMDGLYRCFTSHHSNQEVTALKCLSHFVSTYGNVIVMKMFIPHAESLIEAAKRQLNHKSEGGLMAALAILQLCFEYMSEKMLEDNMNAYCSEIFNPITQFICSPSYVFATGWQLRLRLCHLFIGTISFVGKKLGREGALKYLTGVLQLFFTGFDVVYGVGLMQRDNSLLVNMATNSEETSCQVTVEDVEESVPLVSKALLSATPSKLARNLGSHLGDDTDSKENFVPIQQLCKVFTPKLAHSAYVKMCLVLGQLNLRRELYNTELVEQITYSHDEALQVPMTFPQPSHFAPSCHSSDQSGYTSCDSDDECDFAINNLGPFMDVNKGLSYDESDYGRSLWFVDLDRSQKDILSGHLVTLDEPEPLHTKAPTDPPEMTLDMCSAAFETKFGGLAAQDVFTANRGHSGRKLKTMWAALWETRCQNLRSPYKFHNIKLQTFIGHKATVKCICVPDDEQYFFSGSKDRTVKIWSLHNRGDEIEMYQCQRTYMEHQRPVLSIRYIQNLQQVVSCDSTLHLWDPETGFCIRHISAPGPPGAMFTAMSVVPIAFQPLVALGTSDSHLQFLDVRSKNLVHKWKIVGLEPNGIVKCITCDEHMKWLAVGSNNDVIATLHPHTGEVLASWKTAEFSTGVWKPYTYSYEGDNILQLKSTRRGLLISSNGNGITSLWKPKSKNLIHHIKVGSPSVHCLEIYKDNLITINSSNLVSIYRSYEMYNQTANPIQHKLQGKLLKGNVSSTAFLPNNQTILMGSDNGQIALMA